MVMKYARCQDIYRLSACHIEYCDKMVHDRATISLEVKQKCGIGTSSGTTFDLIWPAKCSNRERLELRGHNLTLKQWLNGGRCAKLYIDECQMTQLSTRQFSPNFLSQMHAKGPHYVCVGKFVLRICSFSLTICWLLFHGDLHEYDTIKSHWRLIYTSTLKKVWEIRLYKLGRPWKCSIEIALRSSSVSNTVGDISKLYCTVYTIQQTELIITPYTVRNVWNIRLQTTGLPIRQNSYGSVGYSFNHLQKGATVNKQEKPTTNCGTTKATDVLANFLACKF